MDDAQTQLLDEGDIIDGIATYIRICSYIHSDGAVPRVD